MNKLAQLIDLLSDSNLKFEVLPPLDEEDDSCLSINSDCGKVYLLISPSSDGDRIGSGTFIVREDPSDPLSMEMGYPTSNYPKP